MIAYFDASCLAMLVLDDRGHDILRHWLDAGTPAPVCSDFGWGELVSAIALRVRQGRIAHDQGQDLVLKAAAFTAAWSIDQIDGVDIAAATTLVARFELKLRLPDAIHIAIARRLDATLVTSDRRQVRGAIALDIPVFDPLAGAAA